jgi:hypothetical protein
MSRLPKVNGISGRQLERTHSPAPIISASETRAAADIPKRTIKRFVRCAASSASHFASAGKRYTQPTFFSSRKLESFWHKSIDSSHNTSAIGFC